MLTSWKTTLTGLLGALAILFGTAVQNKQNGGPPVTAGNLIVPAIVAVLGAVSKDHDVSGT